MTVFIVPILICIVCVFVGLLIGGKIRLLEGRKKVQAARDLQYGELKKMFDLTTSRMKVSTGELISLVDWVNGDLPQELAMVMLSNPKLLVLKDKGGIPDTEFFEAFSDVIVDFQKSVSAKLQGSLDRINIELVKDIKGLMNVQEK